MIIGAIVRMFSYLVAGLFHFLPNIPSSWTAPVAGAISTLSGWAHAFIQPWAYYVPVKLWITLFLLYVALEVGMSVWSGIEFVISLIRGSDHG